MTSSPVVPVGDAADRLVEDPLAAASRDLLLAHQAGSGAFVASPTFPTYAFAWLRDGAYCALALDAAGEAEAAGRFHGWVAGVLAGLSDRVDAVVAAVSAGTQPDPALLLPTRYTLEGEVERDGDEVWPNFQLDGYGTWLFSLREHLSGQALPARLRAGVEVATRYLEATWQLPCYDYWEEFGERRHTSTLASVCAGLGAAADLLGRGDLAVTAERVWDALRSGCVKDGRFVKGPEDDRVDASLLSLAVPFGLVAPDDPVMRATYEAVRRDLVPASGGVRRYVGDTYYGGGSWVLLTCWLGWVAAELGDQETYREALGWVRSHAGEGGALPEQVLEEVQDPSYVAEWIERWGPAADPLLWSHAKYLLMLSAGVTRWS